MNADQAVRIDKYLWAVRLYKTRSQASEECRKGRILINDFPARPSKTLHGDETITVRKPPVTYIYKVTGLLQNRVSAKVAINYYQDITPDSEKAKLDIRQPLFPGYRKKGTGRPTKKERRTIDKWASGFDDKGW